jgi:hypothetical protein
VVVVSPRLADFVIELSQKMVLPDESVYIWWQPVPKSAVRALSQVVDPPPPVPVGIVSSLSNAL